MPRTRYFVAALVLLSALLATFTLPSAAASQDLFTSVTVNGIPVAYFTTETGFAFTTVASPQPITALGRLRTAGSSGTRTMKIYRVMGTLYGFNTKNDDVPEPTVTVNLDSVSDGQFAWGTLSTPFQPIGNTQYIVVSDESAAPSHTEAETISYSLTPGFASDIKAIYQSDATSWDGGVSPTANVYGGANLRLGTPPPAATAVISNLNPRVGEVITVDASASIYSKAPQSSDGSWSLRVEYGDSYPDRVGGLYYPDTYLPLSGHAYQQAGTYTLKVQAKNADGELDEETYTVTVTDVPVGTTPRYLTEQGSPEANGRRLELLMQQAADDIAGGGGDQTIYLPDGIQISTFDLGDGNGLRPISLPQRTDSTTKWITVKWQNVDAHVAPGARVPAARPTQMPVLLHKNYVDYTVSSAKSWLLSRSWFNSTAGSDTHHLRFVGVAMKKADETQHVNGYVYLGNDINSDRAAHAHHFIFDRVHIDGGPAAAAGQPASGGARFAFRADVNAFALSNSRLLRIHGYPDAPGLQSINFEWGSSVWNCTIEASGESVIYGGGGVSLKDSAAPSNFTPSPNPTQVTLNSVTNLKVGFPIGFKVAGVNDPRAQARVKSISGSGPYTVEFERALEVTPDVTDGSASWGTTPWGIEARRSHFTKDPAWKGAWFDQYNNSSVKNHWETKFSAGNTIDSCLFEYNWHGDQNGYSLVLTEESQNNGEQPWLNITHVHASNILFRDVGGFINIKAADYSYNPDIGGGAASRISTSSRNFWFSNLLGYRSGPIQAWNPISYPDPPTPNGIQFTGAERHEGFYLNRSTLIVEGSFGVTMGSAEDGCDDCYLYNSIVNEALFAGSSDWTQGAAIMNAHSSNYLFRKTLWPAVESYRPYPDPLLNFYTKDINTLASHFVNYGGDNLLLANESPGKNAALGGGDVGVDIALLKKRLGTTSNTFAAGATAVETGDWAGGGPADLFTGVTPNRYVAYFNTRTGFQFDTAANPGPVVALGRLKGAGNTGTRTMQIVRKGAAYDGSQDEVVACVTVDLDAVAVGEFAWGTLPAPFQPLGGTTYLCVSDESSAGTETEAELMSAYTLTPGFATNISARYENTGGGTRWAYGPGADNNAYGGVNLRFGGP